jgi:hypothetical protein
MASASRRANPDLTISAFHGVRGRELDHPGSHSHQPAVMHLRNIRGAAHRRLHPKAEHRRGLRHLGRPQRTRRGDPAAVRAHPVGYLLCREHDPAGACERGEIVRRDHPRDRSRTAPSLSGTHPVIVATSATAAMHPPDRIHAIHAARPASPSPGPHFSEESGRRAARQGRGSQGAGCGGRVSTSSTVLERVLVIVELLDRRVNCRTRAWRSEEHASRSSS